MIYDNYDFKVFERKIIRVITDTDAKNEADDQYAVIHALLSPKFDNRGIIAAHFGTRKSSRSMEDSYEEVVKILKLMKMEEKVPVFKGAPSALPDENTPVPSSGSEFIINEALSVDTRPLYILCLGPLTDVASAYLQEPSITDKLTVIWIGGGKYPEGGYEYNLGNDINAANVVFKSKIPLWQIPENVYKMVMVSMAELQYKVKPCGEIGMYLFEQLIEYMHKSGGRECWGLGDSPAVGVLLHSHRYDFDIVPAPQFASDGTYIHGTNNRPIRVYRNVDHRYILEDFYAKLAIFAMK